MLFAKIKQLLALASTQLVKGLLFKVWAELTFKQHAQPCRCALQFFEQTDDLPFIPGTTYTIRGEFKYNAIAATPRIGGYDGREKLEGQNQS
jgi:hypothetical protein